MYKPKLPEIKPVKVNAAYLSNKKHNQQLMLESMLGKQPKHTSRVRQEYVSSSKPTKHIVRNALSPVINRSKASVQHWSYKVTQEAGLTMSAERTVEFSQREANTFQTS